MKVEKKSFEPHPLGWFLFCLGEPEMVTSEYKGKVSTRLLWKCESNERTEDGDRHVVHLYTGMEASNHPMDKHRQLVEDGFGIKLKDYDDTDQIVGQIFAGKVDKTELGKITIVQFDTKERIKPAGKAKASKEDVFRDPFADE